MRKDEFLSSLERLLRSLKREERNKFLSYYSEMAAGADRPQSSVQEKR